MPRDPKAKRKVRFSESHIPILANNIYFICLVRHPTLAHFEILLSDRLEEINAVSQTIDSHSLTKTPRESGQILEAIKKGTSEEGLDFEILKCIEVDQKQVIFAYWDGVGKDDNSLLTLLDSLKSIDGLKDSNLAFQECSRYCSFPINGCDILDDEVKLQKICTLLLASEKDKPAARENSRSHNTKRKSSTSPTHSTDKANESEPQYHIIQTSTESHNCLLAAIAENLIVQAVAGSGPVKEYLQQSQALQGLLENISKKELRSYLDDSTANSEKLKSFNTLASLSGQQREALLGPVLRRYLGQLFMKAGKQKREDQSSALSYYIDELETHLISDFNRYVQSSGADFTLSQELSILEEIILIKFQAFKHLASNEEQKEKSLKEWWQSNGVEEYGRLLQFSTCFLDQMHGFILAEALGLRFGYKHDSDQINFNYKPEQEEQKMVAPEIPCVTVHYTDLYGGHWSAYLNKELVEAFNQKNLGKSALEIDNKVTRESENKQNQTPEGPSVNLETRLQFSLPQNSQHNNTNNNTNKHSPHSEENTKNLAPVKTGNSDNERKLGQSLTSKADVETQKHDPSLHSDTDSSSDFQQLSASKEGNISSDKSPQSSTLEARDAHPSANGNGLQPLVTPTSEQHASDSSKVEKSEESPTTKKKNANLSVDGDEHQPSTPADSLEKNPALNGKTSTELKPLDSATFFENLTQYFQVLPTDHPYFASDCYEREAHVLSTKDGVALALSLSHLDEGIHKASDPQARIEFSVAVKSSENIPADKKNEAQKPTKEALEEKELNSIAQAYGASFTANRDALGLESGKLKIDLRHIGKWKRDAVVEAFKKVGFKYISYQGETLFDALQEETAKKDENEEVNSDAITAGIAPLSLPATVSDSFSVRLGNKAQEVLETAHQLYRTAQHSLYNAVQTGMTRVSSLESGRLTELVETGVGTGVGVACFYLASFTSISQRWMPDTSSNIGSVWTVQALLHASVSTITHSLSLSENAQNSIPLLVSRIVLTARSWGHWPLVLAAVAGREGLVLGAKSVIAKMAPLQERLIDIPGRKQLSHSASDLKQKITFVAMNTPIHYKWFLGAISFLMSRSCTLSDQTVPLMMAGITSSMFASLNQEVRKQLPITGVVDRDTAERQETAHQTADYLLGFSGSLLLFQMGYGTVSFLSSSLLLVSASLGLSGSSSSLNFGALNESNATVSVSSGNESQTVTLNSDTGSASTAINNGIFKPAQIVSSDNLMLEQSDSVLQVICSSMTGACRLVVNEVKDPRFLVFAMSLLYRTSMENALFAGEKPLGSVLPSTNSTLALG